VLDLYNRRADLDRLGVSLVVLSLTASLPHDEISVFAKTCLGHVEDADTTAPQDPAAPGQPPLLLLDDGSAKSALDLPAAATWRALLALRRIIRDVGAAGHAEGDIKDGDTRGIEMLVGKSGDLIASWSENPNFGYEPLDTVMKELGDRMGST
jgi:hypothetical protein